VLQTTLTVTIFLAYIYCRGEYWHEINVLQQAVDEAYAKGFLGPNACGTGWHMDVYVHRGAYILLVS
jgi:NADH:ubiquinone oxidoreductase subunit F (NADH-binding)